MAPEATPEASKPSSSNPANPTNPANPASQPRSHTAGGGGGRGEAPLSLTSEQLVASIKAAMPPGLWDVMSPEFLTTFWSLTLYDIHVPAKQCAAPLAFVLWLLVDGGVWVQRLGSMFGIHVPAKQCPAPPSYLLWLLIVCAAPLLTVTPLACRYEDELARQQGKLAALAADVERWNRTVIECNRSIAGWQQDIRNGIMVRGAVPATHQACFSHITANPANPAKFWHGC